MPPTPPSDEALDRLLSSLDPVDRDGLFVGNVAAARNAVGQALVMQVREPDQMEAARSRPGALSYSRLPHRRRLVLRGVVAVALAAVLVAVGALLPGRGSHTSQIGTPPASAATMLNRAARTALRQNAVPLHKGQFEYLKTLEGLTSSNAPKGLGFGIRFWQTHTLQSWSNAHGPIRLLTTNIRERFFAAEDREIARAHHMSLAQLDGIDQAAARADSTEDWINPPGGDPYNPRPSDFALDPKLPIQPQALLRAIQRQLLKEPVSPNPSRVYELICGGLLYDATSPALRAALYQVLARLPGVRLLGQRTDAVGRKGIAVAMSETGLKSTEEITLIDPRTSEELETENVQTTPIHNPDVTFPADTPINYTVFLTRGIVNSDRDLPGGGQIPGPDTPNVTYAKPSH